MPKLENENKPYEIVLDRGAKALTDAQLVATILRTGSRGKDAIKLSEEIFSQSKTDCGLIGLCSMSIPELMNIKGVGKVKAVQLQCVVELSRRIAKLSIGKKPTLSNPQNIADYYMQDLMYLDKEKVIIVLLDSKLKLIKDVVISIGSINSSMLTPREVFVEVLKYRAVSFILLHNHPSGDPTPSESDIILTNKIFTGSKYIGIPLLDHIVIGNNCYKSFREENLLESNF